MPLMSLLWLLASVADNPPQTQPSADESALVRPLPARSNKLQDTFQCSAVLGTQLTIQGGGVMAVIQGKSEPVRRSLKAAAFAGTDVLNIDIKADSLHFLTQASVRLGLSGTAPLRIVSRFGSSIVAVGTVENDTPSAPVTNVDMIIIDRSSGEGLWHHSRSNYPGTGGPDSQSYFLTCKGAG